MSKRRIMSRIIGFCRRGLCVPCRLRRTVFIHYLWQSGCFDDVDICERESLTRWRVEELNEMLAGYTAQERDDDVERGKKGELFLWLRLSTLGPTSFLGCIEIYASITFQWLMGENTSCMTRSLLLSSSGLYMLSMYNICVGVREIVS